MRTELRALVPLTQRLLLAVGRLAGAFGGPLQALLVSIIQAHQHAASLRPDGLWNGWEPALEPNRVNARAPDVCDPRVFAQPLSQQVIVGSFAWYQQYVRQPGPHVSFALGAHNMAARGYWNGIVADITDRP
jgi:hypothetical protein